MASFRSIFLLLKPVWVLNFCNFSLKESGQVVARLLKFYAVWVTVVGQWHLLQIEQAALWWLNESPSSCSHHGNTLFSSVQAKPWSSSNEEKAERMESYFHKYYLKTIFFCLFYPFWLSMAPEGMGGKYKKQNLLSSASCQKEPKTYLQVSKCTCTETSTWPSLWIASTGTAYVLFVSCRNSRSPRNKLNCTQTLDTQKLWEKKRLSFEAAKNGRFVSKTFLSFNGFFSYILLITFTLFPSLPCPSQDA